MKTKTAKTMREPGPVTGTIKNPSGRLRAQANQERQVPAPKRGTPDGNEVRIGRQER